MASSSSLIALALFPLILVIQCQAQSAPAPSSSSGHVNLTAILEKGGQYTTLMKLLASTQVGSQIENQVNSSTEGMTLFAPTDNAFNNLKAGSLNGLTAQEQVQLVLYHVLPKFYTLENFLTVSNPVRTQASGQNGGQWGLNFTALSGNQVNVSSGVVETQLNNALRQKMPLAVYQVDQVLLPEELFGIKAPASSPSKTPTAAESSNSTESASSSSGSPAEGPASDSGATLTNLGWGSFVGIAFISVMSSLS